MPQELKDEQARREGGHAPCHRAPPFRDRLRQDMRGVERSGSGVEAIGGGSLGRGTIGRDQHRPAATGGRRQVRHGYGGPAASASAVQLRRRRQPTVGGRGRAMTPFTSL